MTSNVNYRIDLNICVNNPHMLWDSALKKALMYPYTTLETVIEMIGPCEDPDIPECLLLLLHPGLSGCELTSLGFSHVSQYENISLI